MTEPDQGVSKDMGIDKPAEPTQVTPISAEEVQQLKKLLDDQKKEISGLNRKVSESEKVIQQKELEKLNEVEREKALAEIARKERLQEQEISASLRRERIVDKALIDVGIPIEFAKHISAKEESEIVAEVKQFKDYIDKLVNEKKEKAVNEALAGKAPVSGAVAGTKAVTEAVWLKMSPKEQASFMAQGGQILG